MVVVGPAEDAMKSKFGRRVRDAWSMIGRAAERACARVQRCMARPGVVRSRINQTSGHHPCDCATSTRARLERSEHKQSFGRFWMRWERIRGGEEAVKMDVDFGGWRRGSDRGSAATISSYSGPVNLQRVQRESFIVAAHRDINTQDRWSGCCSATQTRMAAPALSTTEEWLRRSNIRQYLRWMKHIHHVPCRNGHAGKIPADAAAACPVSRALAPGQPHLALATLMRPPSRRSLPPRRSEQAGQG